MSEMIERVARAICDADQGITNEQVDIWETLARAAIEAMREPTEAMYMRAGNTNVSNRAPNARYIRIGDVAAVEAWLTMVDVALGKLPP